MNKTLTKTIFRKIKNASLRHDLLRSEDIIGVGMSGGKDSLVLLDFLCSIQKYTPLNFTLKPIHIDLGFGNDLTSLHEFCAARSLELWVQSTNIGAVVFEYREEKHPCSLCSNMRRGALNRAAKELGCNRVALGHHRDDVVNTLLMSILFEKQFHVFKPLTYLDRIDLTKIEPMIYVSEEEIVRYTEENAFQIVKNRCPADGKTKRTEVKHLLQQITAVYPQFADNLVGSLENVDINSLWI